jgi:hypothetical protein
MPDSLQPHGLYPCPWNIQGKNTGVGYHFLLKDIFLTQGSNLRLLQWQADSLPLSHQGSPHLLKAQVAHKKTRKRKQELRTEVTKRQEN